MRPVFDPTGGPDVLVEKMIGTAYETVKRVYCHLPEFKRLDAVLTEITTLAQSSVDNALAVAMPPIREELAGYVQQAEDWADASELSAEAAAQSALDAAKVSRMFPFTFNSSQFVYDVTVISGDPEATTAGLALWIEGAIEYDFTITSGTTFVLNNPTYYPENAQMRIIVNARFDDLVKNFDELQDSFKSAFLEFLEKTGYEVPVPYVAGITLVRPTQTVTYLGRDYRANLQHLPLTTSTWEVDSPMLVLVGEGTLRLELSNDSDPTLGAGKIGRATRQIRSVNELVTVAGRYNGDQVALISYYDGWAVMDDGQPSGDGLLVWDANSTAPEDGGKIFAVTGVVVGRWRRQERHYIDTQYGVIGVGDETAAWSRLFGSVRDGRNVYVTRRSRSMPLNCNANSVRLINDTAAYLDTPAILLHAATTTPLLTIGGFGFKTSGGALEDGSVEDYAVNMGSVGLRLKRADGARDLDATISGTLFKKFDIGVHAVGVNVLFNSTCLFSLCLRPIVVDQVGSEIVRGIRVKGARFHGRPTGLIDFCITINGTAQAEVEITDNVADGVGGFYKGHLSRRSRVSGNQVATPAGDAFLFNGGTSGRADNNTIGGGEGNGVIIDGCISPSINSLTIDSVVKSGIILRNCQEAALTNIKCLNVNLTYGITGNIYDGISIESTAALTKLSDVWVRQLNATSGRYGIDNQGNQTVFGSRVVATNFAVKNFNQSLTQRVYGDTGVATNPARRDYGTAPPTVGLYGIGDCLVNTAPSAANPVTEWECAVPGSPGNWKVKSSFTYLGSTALRPTLRADDVGVMYIDTTVGTKQIVWTGTVWKDGAGLTV